VATFCLVANAGVLGDAYFLAIAAPFDERFATAGNRFGEGFLICGREQGRAGAGRRDGFVFSRLSCVQRPLNSFCDIVLNRKSLGDQPCADGVVTLLCAQPFWNIVGDAFSDRGARCVIENVSGRRRWSKLREWLNPA
jgi:hypothetical protein